MTEGGPSIFPALNNSDWMPKNYMLKVSNKDTDTMQPACSKLAVMLTCNSIALFSGIFIANCEHISHFALGFLLLALNRLLLHCSIKSMLKL